MHSLLKIVAFHRFMATVFALGLAGLSGSTFANRADLDLAFGVDGVVRLAVTNGGFNDLVVQPDGKIVAVATSETAGWVIARYNSDGSLDATFGNGGVRTVIPPPLPPAPAPVPARPQPSAEAAVLDASGRLLVVGGPFILRLLADGNLDTSYGSGGFLTAPTNSERRGYVLSDIVASSDGGFLVSGGVYGPTPPAYVALNVSALKLTAAGTLDASFGIDGVASRFAEITRIYNDTFAIAEWNSGIYVGGRIGARWFDYFADLVRFTSSGQVDESVGSYGALRPRGTRTVELAVQPGRGLLVLSVLDSVRIHTSVQRLRGPGEMDPAFAYVELVTDPNNLRPTDTGLIVDADGRIVLAATIASRPVIVSLLPDGATDADFGTDGRRDIPFDGDVVRTMSLQPDGKYLLAGGYTSGVAYIARLRGTAAIPPEVNATPAAGTVLSSAGGLPGTTQSLGTIQFANRGGDALLVDGCAASSGFTVAAPFPLTITHNTSQSVAVSCQLPAMPLTTITGTLVCNSNDADEPQLNFPLQCTSGAGVPGPSSIPTLGLGMQWLLGALMAFIAYLAMCRGSRQIR